MSDNSDVVDLSRPLNVNRVSCLMMNGDAMM
jgi:hypothetical protein